MSTRRHHRQQASAFKWENTKQNAAKSDTEYEREIYCIFSVKWCHARPFYRVKLLCIGWLEYSFMHNLFYIHIIIIHRPNSMEERGTYASRAAFETVNWFSIVYGKLELANYCSLLSPTPIFSCDCVYSDNDFSILGRLYFSSLLFTANLKIVHFI